MPTSPARAWPDLPVSVAARLVPNARDAGLSSQVVDQRRGTGGVATLARQASVAHVSPVACSG